MGAQLLVRRPCTIPRFPTIAGPCKIPCAVGVAGWEPVQANIERQAHNPPVIGRDGGKIGSQSGCFLTARLAQPQAAKFRWFVAVCLHQYCERNDVALPRDRYSIRAQGPNFVL